MKISSVPSLFGVLLVVQKVTESNAQVNLRNCDVSSYYDGLPKDTTKWSRELLHDLVFSSHRRQVQFTDSINPGIDDVWGALIDVDAGLEPGTIRLVYSDEEEIPSIPFGQRGWVRDHIHPLLRGVGIGGPGYTDIHNIRATTPLSDVVKGDNYFGVCGVLTQPETCVEPAEGGTADTCACNRVYQPPASQRGDIARALMYMDLRYDGTEPLTLDLRLTDCPFQAERDMAYLSQMLTWHAEDPPDAQEIQRNNKVCGNWQGNRNPFVDFPQLAEQLFGQPLPLPAVGERLIYEACEAIPTLAPTFEANSCDLYEEGDITFWLLNSQAPLSLGLFTLAPMEGGFEFFVTDNPWEGEMFLEQDGNEFDGTIKFTTPQGGLPGGLVLGYNDPDFPFQNLFEVVEGNFSPSQDGESLFIYCISASGAQRPLTVFNNGGVLAEPGLPVYAENATALPAAFPEQGIINLPHFDNYVFIGSGGNPDPDQLKQRLRTPENWEGSNESRFVPSAGSMINLREAWSLTSILLGTMALLGLLV